MSSWQSLQVHLSSSQGPIDVFLCTDENRPGSPTKNGLDVNGNHTAFVKMSQGELSSGCFYQEYCLHWQDMLLTENSPKTSILMHFRVKAMADMDLEFCAFVTGGNISYQAPAEVSALWL